ncbi:hypothetical protein [Streptomyces griseoluteus]|uniref:hypothetical protein n=1 Tax=Streptomyces griseoluteus TaxID=29306 RepID=UPI0037F1D29E
MSAGAQGGRRVAGGGVSAGVTPLMRGHVPSGRPVVRARAGASRSAGELLAIFDALRRDPSLRLNDAGRNVLRLLDACAVVVRDRGRVLDSVPAHCRRPLAELAEGYAGVWHLLAEELRERDVPDTDLAEPSSLGA